MPGLVGTGVLQGIENEDGTVFGYHPFRKE
jgi:hypothetical protein